MSHMHGFYGIKQIQIQRDFKSSDIIVIFTVKVLTIKHCCIYYVFRLLKIKQWIDENDPGAQLIPFSGTFELKVRGAFTFVGYAFKLCL